jgi:hypothetical protein
MHLYMAARSVIWGFAVLRIGMCMCIPPTFSRLVLTVPVFVPTQGTFSGIFFSALGPILSEVVPLSDFSDALSIIWLVCAPITLVCTPVAFALDDYSRSTLGMTGSDVFLITIGTAGGANIAAAFALFAVKRFQRKEQDV